VTMRGWAQGEGYRIGFGAVTGTIVPAEYPVVH
jgi:fumarylacetoacetase